MVLRSFLSPGRDGIRDDILTVPCIDVGVFDLDQLPAATAHFL
ncbi:hypothetical protein ABAC460_09160 [Asticcacaulis sp. AC460]|nr:hypothetical protein ABAC460_09160 [Asticcacaulis sp. AC460]